ncbi:FAD-dependent oxidoreductase [Amorphus orientalis]|uniref:Succinate dehydrogenase/fumarate reductase flavoprotein subunit n=1 Tax=Amorphus orientalis TaxID=649198 RepID=A0AAE3VMA3_9HYPH|nr:FAD-dependent oxidoreductase [Amorphus orientalis]MDQ0314570.1 succinate dehydrogenase/fumarate reductase flavoprotein subunit [Amorphus orientalis]
MTAPSPEPASSYDLVVFGSGAAGMAAALTAHHAGLTVAIFEKDTHFGGSTAISGGAIWIPDNPKMREAGMEDSREDALRYIAHEAGNRLKPDLVRAFLEAGPEMVTFMEANTELQFEHRAYSPDYHSDSPGAAMGGRVLDAKTYDGRELSAEFKRLKQPIKEFTVFGGMMLNRFDIGHFMKMTRSRASAVHAARLLARHLKDRTRYDRGARLVLGQAVAGRLAASVIRAGIPIFTEAALARLQVTDGRVTGAVLADGREVSARCGVVLATGGFPANRELRQQTMGHVAQGAAHYSMSPRPATGGAIAAARAIGAKFETSNKHAGFWAPVSLIPGPDGPRSFPHLFLDRAKPGVIAVTPSGHRFVSEAVSYHDFVSAMILHELKSAWLVADHRALRRYGLGAVRPFPAPFGRHVRSGYLKKGATLRDLAQQIQVPAEAIIETVRLFNQDAAAGEDTAFGKGSTAYQAYLGDPDNQPNPCLRPLDQGPYYAIQLFPGDIGTTMGLATDASGRVLTPEGRILPGLYACGNDMNSIMAGAYPGAGITLGPALTFGYIVGKSAADSAGNRGNS